MNAIILYYFFLKQSAPPPRLLIDSINSYAKILPDNYFLITNKPREELVGLMRNIFVTNPSQLPGKDDIRLLERLYKCWKDPSINLFANCPEIEVHCFARWFSAMWLIDKIGLSNEDTILFRYWDDVFLGSSSYFLNSLRNIPSQIDLLFSSFYSSDSNIRPSLMPHPNLLLVKKGYLASYLANVYDLLEKSLSLLNSFEINGFYSDMFSRSYMIQISMSRCISDFQPFNEFWESIGSAYYTTMNFRDSYDYGMGLHIKMKKYFVSEAYNYMLFDLAGLRETYQAYDLKYSDCVYIQDSIGRNRPFANIHFHGTEGKYVYLQLRDQLLHYIY